MSVPHLQHSYHHLHLTSSKLPGVQAQITSRCEAPLVQVTQFMLHRGRVQAGSSTKLMKRCSNLMEHQAETLPVALACCVCRQAAYHSLADAVLSCATDYTTTAFAPEVSAPGQMEGNHMGIG